MRVLGSEHALRLGHADHPQQIGFRKLPELSMSFGQKTHPRCQKVVRCKELIVSCFPLFTFFYSHPEGP